MRTMIALEALLVLGALAAAIAFWAGADQGAPIAFTLAAFAVGIGIMLGIAQVGNWGVPGDESPIRWGAGH